MSVDWNRFGTRRLLTPSNLRAPSQAAWLDLVVLSRTSSSRKSADCNHEVRASLRTHTKSPGLRRWDVWIPRPMPRLLFTNHSMAISVFSSSDVDSGRRLTVVWSLHVCMVWSGLKKQKPTTWFFELTLRGLWHLSHISEHPTTRESQKCVAVSYLSNF